MGVVHYLRITYYEAELENINPLDWLEKFGMQLTDCLTATRLEELRLATLQVLASLAYDS